jgi:hypothetical protein
VVHVMPAGPIDSRYCTETDPLEPGVQPPERSVWWKTRGEIHADAHLMMHQVCASSHGWRRLCSETGAVGDATGVAVEACALDDHSCR